jgi:hypothetical protein
LPVNFRPQACRQHEVEGADGYAVRSVPDIVCLVPDFSVMTLGTGPEGDTKAVLMLGDEREARVFRCGARGWKPRRAAVGDLLAYPVAE